MQIVVAGAAGGVGNKLVSELASGGHSVVGLVHSQDKFTQVEEAGGMPVLADVTDKSTLEDPLSDADVVVFAAGSGGNAVDEVDRDGAINLIDVANEQGVDRFVMLSSMAAGEPGRGPDSLRDYLVAKGEADDYLQSSNIEYVIVKPGSLTDDGGAGEIQVGVGDSLPSGKIARSDLAKTLAFCATAEGIRDITFEVIEGDDSITDALAFTAK